MLEQLDYIFFIYGLSFILLAAQCLVLRHRDRLLPWGWLAAFGITHGLNEWLDMLAISLPDTPIFKVVRLIVMTASFVALVEFGRRGLVSDGHPLIGRWLTPTLLGLALLGVFSCNLNLINAACRYTLGFPGALICGYALWRAHRACPHDRYGLGAAALSMIVYGIASGLVVPKAPLFLANWLNHDAFLAVTGFPIQLMRMLCALTAMSGFWFYRLHCESSTEHIGFVRRWACPMVLILLVTLAWFTAEVRGKKTDAYMRGQLLNQAVSIADTVNPERMKALSVTAADKDNPAFQRLRQEMEAYGRIVPDSMWLYLMVKQNQKAVFAIDIPLGGSEKIESPAEPGEIYTDASADLLGAFKNKRPFTEGPLADQWGDFVSSFAPVRNPRTGEVIAVVGIDILARDWKARVAVARILPIICVLILVVILLGGMGAIHWRNSLAPEKQFLLRYLEPALVAAVGLTFTAIALLLTLESGTYERERIFHDIAKTQAQKVSNGFSAVRFDTVALSRFMQTDEQVTRQEFHEYAGPMVESGATQGHAWIRRVPAAQKRRFESELQHEGIRNFAIWQKDARGRRVPSLSHAKYYPVIFQEQLNNKTILGLDLGSEPMCRTALEMAIRTGFPTAADSVTTIRQNSQKPSLMVFDAVFAKRKLVGSEERLTGITLSTIRYQTLLDHVVDSNLAAANLIAMRMMDLTSANAPRLLAEAPKEATRDRRNIFLQSYQRQYEFHDTSPIFAFGRAYAIVARPTPAFFAAYPIRNHIVTGVAGIIITAVLSLLAMFISDRKASLECEVRERTGKLQESEEFQRTLMANLPSGVVIINPQTRIIESVNAQAAAWFGSDESLIVGQRCHGYFCPSSEGACPVCDLGKTVENSEWEMLRADGSRMPILKSVRLIQVRGEERLLECFVDVTERKQAEEKLRESEATIRNITDSAQDAILMMNSRGLIVFWNPAAERILGYTADEALGQNLHKFLVPARYRDAHSQAFPGFLKTGRGEAVGRTLELHAICKGNKEITVSLSLSAVKQNGEWGAVGILRDITESKLAEATLKNVAERLELATRAGGVGVWDYDTVNNILTWDAQMFALYGITGDQFESVYEAWQAGLHPEDKQRGDEETQMALRGEKDFDTEFRVIWPNGSIHYVRALANVQRDASGQPLRMVGTNWDITELKLTEMTLADNERRYRSLWESASEGFCLHELIMDEDGIAINYRILDVNPVYESITGMKASDVVGKLATEAYGVAEPPYLEVYARVALTGTPEHFETTFAQMEKHFSISVFSPSPGQFATAFSDISERKTYEDVLAHQATHDSLTGLPNRQYFEQHLDKLIRTNPNRQSVSMAILFIDLDNFKMVNDTMGHKAGDILLVETAARLSSCVRDRDTLARLGGDEFAVVLNDVKSTDTAAMIAQRMLDQISVPFEIDGNRLVIGTSIGISIYPNNANDVIGLLKSADAAMYRAKTLGRNNYQFFSKELSEANLARVQLESDLRLAIERDELNVYYQPIVDVNTMEIAGAEALLRWEHPDKGVISPSLFIPVAEQTGLILQMGKMVLETACKQCRSWHDLGYKDFKISVNVSPIQLSDFGFVAEVDGALSQADLPTHSLKLEVTETTLAKNENDELDILSVLKSLGVGICIDDFGVGYSSLGKLSSLPISHVKIDGYFTGHCDHNKKDRAMTESIITMAHNLGLQVTAEWVEDQEQMATIRSLGCDYAQGYLVSPALSPQAFEDFIRYRKNDAA